MRRVAAVQPGAYARTRNFLDGAVTRLSPYLTHGLLTVAEVRDDLRHRHGLRDDHKLVSELGWREYFHHVWRHEPHIVDRSRRAGPRADSAYATAMPMDVRHAATGVPVIDRAVETLYATGYLHNHARMWLASYVVHLRGVHWRAGADWLYGHLVDGDLASNHLSWQWVAGTASAKPYLFNAGNVERYAPPDWRSPGTIIDRPYGDLDAIAFGAQPPEMGPSEPRVAGAAGMDEPDLLASPPATHVIELGSPPDEPGVRWRHPWDLPGADVPADSSGPTEIAVIPRAFTERWPWSERRWTFVLDGFGGRPVYLADGWPARAAGVHDPHLRAVWGQNAPASWTTRTPAWLDPVAPGSGAALRSYSAYWKRVQRR